MFVVLLDLLYCVLRRNASHSIPRDTLCRKKCATVDQEISKGRACTLTLALTLTLGYAPVC